MLVLVFCFCRMEYGAGRRIPLREFKIISLLPSNLSHTANRIGGINEVETG